MPKILDLMYFVISFFFKAVSYAIKKKLKIMELHLR